VGDLVNSPMDLNWPSKLSRLRDIHPWMIASCLLFMCFLDLSITYWSCSNHATLFFEGEVNVYFKRLVISSGFGVAAATFIVIDSSIALLSFTNFGSFRAIAASRAIIHSIGLNWFLFVNGVPTYPFIAAYNLLIKSIAAVVFFSAVNDIINDFLLILSNFRKKLASAFNSCLKSKTFVQ